MDPQLARRHVQDAMAESYMSTSPYAYCGNDPINKFDVMGLYEYDNMIPDYHGWSNRRGGRLHRMVEGESFSGNGGTGFSGGYSYSWGKGQYVDPGGNQVSSQTAIGSVSRYFGSSNNGNSRVQSSNYKGTNIHGISLSQINTGDAIPIPISAIIGFCIGLFSGDNPVEKANQMYSNAMEINAGLLQGEWWEIASRLTLELPQTAVAYLLAQTVNFCGGVQSVSHYMGVTGVETTFGYATIGSYIFGMSGNNMNYNSDGFQHEYGHRVQSYFNPLYGLVGGMSLLSQGFNYGIHKYFWTEINANMLSKWHLGNSQSALKWSEQNPEYWFQRTAFKF